MNRLLLLLVLFLSLLRLNRHGVFLVGGEAFHFHALLLFLLIDGSLPQLVHVVLDYIVHVEKIVEQHFHVFFQLSFVGREEGVATGMQSDGLFVLVGHIYCSAQ